MPALRLGAFFLLMISLLPARAQPAASDLFAKEVEQIKSQYHIPGLAVLVKQGEKTVYEQYLGNADQLLHKPVDSLTVFPIASLTKIFSSILLLQLVEEGKLQLEDSVARFITNRPLPPHLKVMHLLSHTSQGEAGKQFYYSGRFSRLTQVLEKASSQKFADLLQNKILIPLGLNHTTLLTDSAATRLGSKLAKGYQYNGETTAGPYEYGYSTAAGLVTNVHDLAKFDNALNKNILISEKSKQKMFTPFVSASPYGLGIFSQRFLNKTLVWGYGQYESFGSLYVKVPEENLTLLVTANNNLMSDAPRLIYGDLTYSLVAMSFLKNYVFRFHDLPVLSIATDTTKITALLRSNLSVTKQTFLRQQLLAQALTNSFLGRYHPNEWQKSKALLKIVFKHFPDVKGYSSLSLMHNLSILSTMDNITDFDQQFKQVGKLLLEKDPHNPYANYYLAVFYDKKGDKQKAFASYQKIIKAPNFDAHWYTALAKKYVEQNKQ